MTGTLEKFKQKYQKDGYVIIDTNLDEASLDGVRKDLENFFGDDREHPIHVPHADYGRIQDAWHITRMCTH